MENYITTTSHKNLEFTSAIVLSIVPPEIAKKNFLRSSEDGFFVKFGNTVSFQSKKLTEIVVGNGWVTLYGSNFIITLYDWKTNETYASILLH